MESNNSKAQNQWNKFNKYRYEDSDMGFSLDISRVTFPDVFFERFSDRASKALRDMVVLEKGGIANPDENRMVGHYWLRAPELSPSAEIKEQIESANRAVKEFAARIHSGDIAAQDGGIFKSVLVIGIGGSALGPQFVSSALWSSADAMTVFFFDNTDPDGMQRVLAKIPDLRTTLCLVISKSGGTKETRNGMLVAKNAYIAADLDYKKCFVAVTGEGSELDKFAIKERWLARFPMWDWVGGRTSELSAVGLLPAALQGIDTDQLLAGARKMDERTRANDVMRNPALMLSLMWFQLGGGKGARDMVILPYNDRLELISRYLQQLVMESLGKEKDLDGRTVNQGLAVYGNKGSTDQHAYVQQLRDGIDNFFVLFIQVLKDASMKSRSSNFATCVPGDYSAAELEVEPGVLSGDYLNGFYLGTREALTGNGRQSITISVTEVNEYTVGYLIALFERAVGFYASLIGVNAYHQPGVEAGKKAASEMLKLQGRVMAQLKKVTKPQSVEEIAQALESQGSEEAIYLLLKRGVANGRIPTKRIRWP